MPFDENMDEIQTLNELYRPKGYNFVKPIGQGTQALNVYLVERAPQGGVQLPPLAAKVYFGNSIDDVVKRELKGWQGMSENSQHPAIIKFHELDTATYQGYAVIFMEYFPGQELHKFVYKDGAVHKSRNLNAADYCAVIDDVLHGLQHAHLNNIVHRDMKPDNILVRCNKAPAEYCVKILDFGISRILGEKGSSTRGATGYRAPEAHSSRTIMLSEDIFSTGIILYELFAGNLRDNIDGISGDIAEVRKHHEIQKDELAKIVETRNKPMKFKTTGVPDESIALLSKVIDCCLRYDPAERYRSVESLRIDLKLAFKPGTVKNLEGLAANVGTPQGVECFLKECNRIKGILGTNSAVYFKDSLFLNGVVNQFGAHREKIEKEACAYAALIQTDKFTPTEHENAQKALSDLLKETTDSEKAKALAYFNAAVSAPKTAMPTKGSMDPWKELFKRIAKGGELAELCELWMIE